MAMVMGLRCSNTDYHFVLLTGTKSSPVLKQSGSFNYPKGLKKPFALKWMLEETRDRLQKCTIDRVVIKASEPLARPSGPLTERTEFEAAVLIACAQSGLKAAFKKVKSTIAKDLGMKGKAKYLLEFDTSAITDFDSFSEKTREAILAAWTELP
jgi:hypothetical protein